MRPFSAIALLALIGPAYADPPDLDGPATTFAVEGDPGLPAGLFVGGQRVREVTVYRTGVIVFDGAGFDPTPRPLGELVMGKAIAAFWAPLEPGACPDDAVHGTVTRVDLPDGLRFEWVDVPVVGCPGAKASFTADLRLDEDGALVGVELTYTELPFETLPTEPRAGLHLHRPAGSTTMELFPDPAGGVLRGRAKWLAEGSSDGVPGVWTIDLNPEGQVVGERELERVIDPETDERDRPDGWRASDNCARHHNPLQENLDGDRLGDACDTDIDNDGILNPDDNCPRHRNRDQRDTDGDGAGDACDGDDDGDGWPDRFDRCPTVFDPINQDLDDDGLGDACDPDQDGDDWAAALQGILGVDRCPLIYDPWRRDDDRDGIGNPCDLAPKSPCGGFACFGQRDDDGDRVSNIFDRCPATYDPAQTDRDGDGLGDACDPDHDGDDVLDVFQALQRGVDGRVDPVPVPEATFRSMP